MIGASGAKQIKRALVLYLAATLASLLSLKESNVFLMLKHPLYGQRDAGLLPSLY